LFYLHSLSSRAPAKLSAKWAAGLWTAAADIDAERAARQKTRQPFRAPTFDLSRDPVFYSNVRPALTPRHLREPLGGNDRASYEAGRRRLLLDLAHTASSRLVAQFGSSSTRDAAQLAAGRAL